MKKNILEQIMGEVYVASRRMATVHTPTRFYRAIGTRQVEDILRRTPLCDIDDVIRFLTDQGQAEAAELLREYGGRKEEPYNKMALKEHQAAQRREEIYQQIPEIKTLDKQIAKISVEAGKKLINGESVLEQFRGELMELKKKRSDLLRENGYPGDYLNID